MTNMFLSCSFADKFEVKFVRSSGAGGQNVNKGILKTVGRFYVKITVANT